MKPIQFMYQGQRLVFQMEKIDRSKLYGSKELQVFDETGSPCELATLAEDGKTLVGKGGTGICQLTSDGKWTDKTKLTPVDLEGHVIQPVSTSFAAPIDLELETTVDDYLNHNIRLVYLLSVDSDSASAEELIGSLKRGAIFKFPYSFRGGLIADTGFLLANEKTQIFFLVGGPTAFEFVGLQPIVPLAEDEECQEGDEDELMDFAML